MRLDRLTILNFKNIAEADLLFAPGVNCLIGNNGMGKTNVLDAIHFLSFCRSSASLPDSELMRHGEQTMLVQGHYTRRGTDEHVTIGLQRGRRKAVKRNGKEYRRLSAHIGLLPLVMCTPADWDIIRGASDERRRFVDQVVAQTSAQYLDDVIRYGKALEQRNALLRQEANDELLYAAVEQVMAQTAACIHAARAEWADAFTPIFAEHYRDIAGSAEQVALAYRSHLDEAPLTEHFAATRQRDLAIGHTTRGVHRDDLELTLDGHPLRRTGSQGQCKTCTIALRLAQFEFLRQAMPTTPLLLLDDIFDKLDTHRVERIVEVVASDRFGQIFITDTNRDHLDSIMRRLPGDHRLFGVDCGTVSLLGDGGASTT